MCVLICMMMSGIKRKVRHLGWLRFELSVCKKCCHFIIAQQIFWVRNSTSRLKFYVFKHFKPKIINTKKISQQKTRCGVIKQTNPLKLWCPISEQAAKPNNKKIILGLFATKRQLIWLGNVCTNLIVKPFSRNKNKTFHTFYFDIKLSFFSLLADDDGEKMNK